MRNFIIKTLLFLSPLVLVPVIFYLIIDPFKVLYKYSEQINTDKNYQIVTNRDFQSTQLLLSYYKKYDYNSFIFGNSRSTFFQVTTWNKFIQGNCFHFDASNESIYGIYCKLKLLESLKININNALIILDAKTLTVVENQNGHLFIMHPESSKESYFTFHIEMFRGFFPRAMYAHMDLWLTNKKKPYMDKYGIRDNVFKQDVVSNQIKYFVYDEQLSSNPDLYYANRMSQFYKRDTIQIYSEPVIKKEQEEILESIRSILVFHNTKYKIIISPLYDQFKLNHKDLNYLINLFGSENVFDFSGINSFTNDYHNYYENSHYRPLVCDSIINIIYK